MVLNRILRVFSAIQKSLFSDPSNLKVLEADLSRLREEIKDITISKNKLIEEAHEKITSLEINLHQKEENQTKSQLKITELLSKMEQIR